MVGLTILLATDCRGKPPAGTLTALRPLRVHLLVLVLGAMLPTVINAVVGIVAGGIVVGIIALIRRMRGKPALAH